jgi:hypothetical protein
MILAMAIYSTLALCAFLSNSVNEIPPQFQPIYRSGFEPLVRKCIQNRDRALHYAAYFEVASLVISIVNIFMYDHYHFTLTNIQWTWKFDHSSWIVLVHKLPIYEQWIHSRSIARPWSSTRRRVLQCSLSPSFTYYLRKGSKLSGIHRSTTPSILRTSEYHRR